MFTKVDRKGLVRIPKNKYADDNIVYPYKDRKIDIEQPVQIYRNLHKNCYSIRQFGLVVAHAKRVCLKYCRFLVNEKGREKVRQTKHKTVHAFIEGFYDTSGMGTTAAKDLRLEVKYNPFREDYFTCYNLIEKPVIVKTAWFVILDEKKVTAAHMN